MTIYVVFLHKKFQPYGGGGGGEEFSLSFRLTTPPIIYDTLVTGMGVTGLKSLERLVNLKETIFEIYFLESVASVHTLKNGLPPICCDEILERALI